MVRPVVYFTCSVFNKNMHAKIVKYNMHTDQHTLIHIKNVNFCDSITVQVKDYLFVMDNNSKFRPSFKQYSDLEGAKRQAIIKELAQPIKSRKNASLVTFFD